MKYVYQSLSQLIFIATIALIGCAIIPTQEMSNARQAIQAAYSVKAAHYVPEGLIQAEQSLAQAEQYLQEGQFEQARSGAILAKEQAVNTYNMAIALDRAQTIWQALITMNHSSTSVKVLLEQAREAAHQNQIKKTISLANKAAYQGEFALNQAQLRRAKILIEQFKTQQTQLQPEELNLLKLAQAAYLRQEGKKAYELLKQLLKNLLP